MNNGTAILGKQYAGHLLGQGTRCIRSVEAVLRGS